MSDLFLACLTSLSVQIPILTTLVALIHKHDREFSSLVRQAANTSIYLVLELFALLIGGYEGV
jgi:hypothetical protein